MEFRRVFFRSLPRRGGLFLATVKALVCRLLKSAIAAGVSLRNDSRVLRLLVSNGRITGVEVQGPRGTMDVCARQGVVIATGGFGANMAMRRRYLPQADTGRSEEHTSELQSLMRISYAVF